MTTPPDPRTFLKLIAHDVRWQLLRALADSDWRVLELTRLVNQPQNLVSYHLQKLKREGLVCEHHSSADAREIYYSLNLALMSEGLRSSAVALHPALWPGMPAPAPLRRMVRVLFLCTHNSARSQMAEGFLRAWGSSSVEVESAGSQPGGVHPLAVEVMQEQHIDIGRQTSKGVEAVSGKSFDYVITVCDLARETCPVFPGEPAQVHWSIPDPSLVNGSLEDRRAAFRAAADQIGSRVRYLLQRIPAEQANLP